MENTRNELLDNFADMCRREEEANRYKVVTICSSNRFRYRIPEIKKELTMQGYIVIDPVLFDTSINRDANFVKDNKSLLIEMHKRRILMSDLIYVVNVGGFISEHVQHEIDFAIEHGKGVMLLEHDEDFVKQPDDE